MKAARRLLVFFLFIAITRFASGQYGSFGLTDARQLGMGNTFVTNSRELYAAGKNPALLAHRVSDRRLDILFPNLSAREYNVTNLTGFIDDYFSQDIVDIITGFDGDVILKAIENEGKLYLGLQIGFLGAGYTHNDKIGSFSFVMKDFLDGYLQLPKVIVNEINSGEKIEKSIIFRDFNFQATWSRAYELSYGRTICKDCIDGITEINAGIGIKYIQGFINRNILFTAGAGHIDENGILTGTYETSSTSAFSDDIKVENMFEGEPIVDGVIFLDPVGNGFGLDLGLSLVSERGVNVGLSLTDAGFINWNGKTKKTFVSGIIKIDSTLSIDDLDSLAKLITIETQTDNQFQTHPTSAFHLGFSFDVEKMARNFPGQMGIALELHQGLTNALNNPEYPRAALGINWKPGKKWPVFLTGLSNSLDSELVWSLGIGYELRFVELYLASPNFIPTIQGDKIKTLSFSACWHFVKAKKKGKVTSPGSVSN